MGFLLSPSTADPWSSVAVTGCKERFGDNAHCSVKFWYLGKWSPSVIDVPNTKGGKVPLPYLTLCYKVKVTL
jgi:hypothetical protein